MTAVPAFAVRAELTVLPCFARNAKIIGKIKSWINYMHRRSILLVWTLGILRANEPRKLTRVGKNEFGLINGLATLFDGNLD